MLFVLKTGIPWEDLPERYGKPNSVWEQVFRALGEDDREEELAEVHLDSSTVKAQQTASTSRRELREKKVTPTTGVVLGAAAGV